MIQGEAFAREGCRATRRRGRTTLTMSSMMSRLRDGSTPSLGLGASIAISAAPAVVPFFFWARQENGGESFESCLKGLATAQNFFIFRALRWKWTLGSWDCDYLVHELTRI